MGRTVGRRDLLAGIGGGLGALGVLGAGLRVDEGDVAIWLSEAATDYADLPDRILDVLEPAFAEAGLDATVSVRSRPVPLAAEQGATLMREQWPLLVARGYLRSGPVRPPGRVNVLVTDGDPGSDPAGYGMWRVAAVTGAGSLADLPETVRETAVVDYSVPSAVAQLLLHECGHALGLEHEHGEVRHRGDGAVASPMVGGYAWAATDVRRRQVGRAANVCGGSLAPGGPGHRRLALRYGDCASQRVGRARW